MDRLIAENSVNLAGADVAPLTGTPQYATDGDPVNSIPPTIFPAYAFNAVQEELMAIILAAGVTPDRAVNNQVLTALSKLQRGASFHGVDTGAANTMVVDLTPNLAAYAAGVFLIVAPANNGTGAATLNVDGLGARAIVRNDTGAALAAGDLAAGVAAMLIDDGTRWRLLNPAAGADHPGSIKMWNSAYAAIPTGWHLCDGSNATPDLRGRFIIGAGGAYANGDTGGAANVTPTIQGHALTVAELAAHSHGVTDPGHHHLVGQNLDNLGANIANHGLGTPVGQLEIADTQTSDATTGITIQNTGSGDAHTHTADPVDVRPPYYALCFIMKL